MFIRNSVSREGDRFISNAHTIASPAVQVRDWFPDETSNIYDIRSIINSFSLQRFRLWRRIFKNLRSR